MTKASAQFDDVIHSPTRLRICGLLRSVSELEFSAIRDVVNVSDASLSKSLKVLAESGFVVLRKEKSFARKDSRRLTWVSLTDLGKSAFDSHVAALTLISQGILERGFGPSDD